MTPKFLFLAPHQVNDVLIHIDDSIDRAQAGARQAKKLRTSYVEGLHTGEMRTLKRLRKEIEKLLMRTPEGVEITRESHE